MTPFPMTTPAQNVAPVLPPPVCPRCRAELEIVRRKDRRAERLTALLCPSIVCGYKLIVPR